MRYPWTKTLLLCACGVSLSGCASLGRFSRQLEANREPWFIYFTSDVRLTPGAATRLPEWLLEPGEPIMQLESCGVVPVTTTTSSVSNPILRRRKYWYDLQFSCDRPELREWAFFRDLAQIGRGGRYAVITFEEPVWHALDTTATTRQIRQRFQNDNVVIAEQLAPCIDEIRSRGLAVVHSTIRARLRIQFRSCLLVTMDVERHFNGIRDRLAVLGSLRWDDTTKSLVSDVDWTVARTGQLRLKSNAYFEEERKRRGATEMDVQHSSESDGSEMTGQPGSGRDDGRGRKGAARHRCDQRSWRSHDCYHLGSRRSVLP